MWKRNGIKAVAGMALAVAAAADGRAQVVPAQPAPAPVQVVPGQVPAQPGQVPAQPGVRPVQPAAPAYGTRPAQGQLGRAGQPGQGQGQGQPNIMVARDMPGPIDSLSDVQDSLKMAFMAADQDHDGQISREEAVDAGNMLVGGIFFAADADGDGKVTREESREVREKVMKRNPLLRFASRRVDAAKDRNEDGDKGDKNENPLRSIANLLDSDSDKALSAAEVRQVVSTAVGAIYDTADEDRDGKMSPDEWNNAAYGLARSAVETAFQAADKDNDRALSRDEFTEALAEPTRTAFSILDADGDGKLTGRELEQTGRVLGSQLRSIRIPQAKNSPDRLIREGRADEIIKAGGESRTEKRDDDR